MDEPLCNLDAKLRVEMRAYIARLHQELGTTTLYVTHDQTEAMTMGDRVAVMRDGRLEQVDTPQRLYEQPENLFVAGFIGSPAMNLVRGVVDDDGIVLGGQRLPFPRRTTYRGDVVVGIRPEALEPANGDATTPCSSSRSSCARCWAPTSSCTSKPRPRRSSPATCSTPATTSSRTRRASSRASRRTSARAPGERVRLRVDMSRVHLFDPATEAVIRR